MLGLMCINIGNINEVQPVKSPEFVIFNIFVVNNWEHGVITITGKKHKLSDDQTCCKQAV